MTLVALFADHLGELAIAYSRVSSFISGPLLGIFLLAVLTKRTTPAGALIGSGAGAAAVVVCSFLTRWSFLYLGPIGVAATFIVGYLVSLPMTSGSGEDPWLCLPARAKSTLPGRKVRRNPDPPRHHRCYFRFRASPAE